MRTTEEITKALEQGMKLTPDEIDAAIMADWLELRKRYTLMQLADADVKALEWLDTN